VAIVSPKRGTPSAAVTCSPASADLRRTYHGDVEVLDLLAQRIAIEPQEACRAQLIPARCPERQRQERPLLSLALGATRGNQLRAARLLGLNRNTLRKKIKDLDVPVVRTPQVRRGG